MAHRVRLANHVLSQFGLELRHRAGELTALEKGMSFGRTADLPELPGRETQPNELESYFDSLTDGPGLWKWRHYFPVYDRHLSRFVGQSVKVVEIGVFSGGSLGMWRSYFGSSCNLYGIDIEPTCRAHEAPGTQIFIGDQADPAFWTRFLEEVPEIDVVIDDGGHETFQQIPTLEALLPRLRPGGVYICEDIHSERNDFHEYIHGLSLNLHEIGAAVPDGYTASAFQRTIDSIHLYPFMSVIEKRSSRVENLLAPKRGTQWEPFYEGLRLPGDPFGA